jgi:hypothetical protein
MQSLTNDNTFAGAKSPGAKRSERGVALIITLTLLALLSAASLAMVLTVSSDTLINGYYRSYRGSFYAADSGVNVVVAAIKNSIISAAAPTSNPPLPAGVPATVTSSYAPYQAAYYTIGDTNSWNGQFEMIANPSPFATTVVTGPATTPVGTPVGGNANNLGFTINYNYAVTVQGRSSGGEAEQVTETGVITYTSSTGSGTAGGPPSFAKWGAFITQFSDCQGPLVPGTMTGPFFTDGQWNLGNNSNPGYTFTDSVGQVGANVSWWNNNNCTDSPTTPNGFTQPNFASGLQLNQSAVTPPTNSYNQEQAILDGKGAPPCTATPCAADPAPSQTQMNQELKTVTGTTYPATGTASNGVYFPSYTSGTSPITGQPCTTSSPCYGGSTAVGGDGYGGGFLVQGNATVTLSATTTGVNPTQTYTITQGATTTTIVVNNTAGTTTVTQGSGTTTYQGYPEQLDPTAGTLMTETDPSGNAVNPTLIYVNGQITGMSGTIQNNTGITIAASNNVSITGDLLYTSQPVSTPADVLNSSTNAGVLGVYTNGNINLYPNASGSNSGNLTVDASLAAIGSGSSGFETPGSSIGTWQILGGRAEDHAHSVSIGTGNTYYDRRFANNFGPPWFPTAVPQAGQIAAAAQPAQVNVTRSSWQEDNRF